jgi:hypothetical protein
LLGCVPFDGDTIGYNRVLGLVSFDHHPGSPLFSHHRRTLLFLISVFSFDHSLSLSAEGYSRSDNNTRSLSLLRRSLTRYVCPDVPAGLSSSPFPPARALRIALNFSPQKASAAAGRPATCAMAKGPVDVDRAVLCVVAVTATPHSILLLGCARLVESPRQGGN